MTSAVSHLVETLPFAFAPIPVIDVLSAMPARFFAISGVMPVPWPPASTHFAADAFIELELGELQEDKEKYFSINPYAFIPEQPLS